MNDRRQARPKPPGLVLQHDRDVPPALLGDWLEARGIPWRLVRVWEEGVPEPGPEPFVVSLGSEHSAGASAPPWVPDEIGLLRAEAERGIPMLGLCFGGQALARALGGRIHPAEPPEVGWDEIESLDAEAIPPGRWLNFHFESFTLPPGSELLARSPAGPSAFRRGPHLGLQFHPEATPELAEMWATREREDRRGAIDPERVARDGASHGADAGRRAWELFDRWWARAREGSAEPGYARPP